MLRWLAPLTVTLLAACGDTPLEGPGVDDSSGGPGELTEPATTAAPTTGEPTTAGPGTNSASGTTGDDADTTAGADVSSAPAETTTSPDPTGDDTTSTGADDTTTTGADDTTGDTTTGDTEGDAWACLTKDFVNQGALVIDYEQFGGVLGSHCKGTNHQDITDIERVVFLGDSVTVGTPPTGGDDFYRSQLAEKLKTKFGLSLPNPLWKQVNPVDGVALTKTSGDFTSCAKWGARTDDFKPGMGGQIDDCFPPDQFDKRTLVIYTMGGNDLAAIAKDGTNGVALDQLQMDAESAVALQREAVHWFVDDEDKFPNGVFVVFANVYEFSDGTGDLMSCPQASLAGFDKPYPNPDELKQLVIWMNEQFMDIAVETQTDMMFLLENFCGHGFKADDPTAPCYRGPDQETWFDLTCIHPTPTGHDRITEMFSAVIDE